MHLKISLTTPKIDVKLFNASNSIIIFGLITRTEKPSELKLQGVQKSGEPTISTEAEFPFTILHTIHQKQFDSSSYVSPQDSCLKSGQNRSGPSTDHPHNTHDDIQHARQPALSKSGDPTLNQSRKPERLNPIKASSKPYPLPRPPAFDGAERYDDGGGLGVGSIFSYVWDYSGL